MAEPGSGTLLFVGTYTRKGSEGIYALRMDPETGRLGPARLAAKAENPSFLAAHPRGNALYAVSELGRKEGKPAGAVAAYGVDAAKGGLAERARRPTGGAAPCHLAADPSGRLLVAANYTDGSIAVFPLDRDGAPGEAVQTIRFEGSGPDTKRQTSPHAHGVTFSPDGRFVLVPDLGTDRVRIFRLDTREARLTENDPAYGSVAPGAGPRHACFHPALSRLYVINEMASTLTAFSWEGPRGALAELCTVGTLPAGFEGSSTTAEVAVHPSGKFLYGSNRGHDSIAVYALDAATGRPSLVQHEPTGGRTPRNFALDPSGRFLVAANQDSDNLVVFRVDAETGRLSPTGFEAAVPTPVCVLFW
jgi:6-phosphogluconolactonase